MGYTVAIPIFISPQASNTFTKPMFWVGVGLPENLVFNIYFKLNLKSFLCIMPQRVMSLANYLLFNTYFGILVVGGRGGESRQMTVFKGI